MEREQEPEGAGASPQSLSNWDRFGPGDQRGTLNLLTPDRVSAALARSREGRVFSLGTPVGRHGPLTGGRNPTWHVTVQVDNPSSPGDGRAEDMLVVHTHAHTHIDGLAHVWFGGRLYNGVAAAGTVSRGGTRHASVEHYGGIVGSAVVLDLTPDGPFERGHALGVELLERAARRSGADCHAADVILVRTGWDELFKRDPESYAAGEPGLGPDAADWIARCDPACVGMDNYAIEPVPAPARIHPLHCHRLFLRDLGTPLIECLDLSEPAAAGVSEGLFVAAPLRVERGLGSPLNPLLIV